MKEHYDLIILGAGTGGLRTAVIAAKSGYKTAVAEYKHAGGTCLNTGCIPTKALLHSAHIYNLTQNSGDVGIKSKSSVDFGKIMSRMRGIVHQGRTGAEQRQDH